MSTVTASMFCLVAASASIQSASSASSGAMLAPTISQNAFVFGGDAFGFQLLISSVLRYWATCLLPLSSVYQFHNLSQYPSRSEEHTSELQSLRHLVCRLLLE